MDNELITVELTGEEISLIKFLLRQHEFDVVRETPAGSIRDKEIQLTQDARSKFLKLR